MKTVAAFLEDYFGFYHDFLGVVSVVLIIFPVVFASLFGYFIGKLDFQKRWFVLIAMDISTRIVNINTYVFFFGYYLYNLSILY